MKIPIELQGKKAEKFEEYADKWIDMLDVSESQGHATLKALIEYSKLKMEYVLDFLRQPFTPSLIEELFEGWEHDGVFYLHIGSEKRDLISFSYIEEKLDSIWINNKRCQIPPKTLADFIACCNNSNIELIFKEN